jgi:hypothetical protein
MLAGGAECREPDVTVAYRRVPNQANSQLCSYCRITSAQLIFETWIRLVSAGCHCSQNRTVAQGRDSLCPSEGFHQTVLTVELNSAFASQSIMA